MRKITAILLLLLLPLGAVGWYYDTWIRGGNGTFTGNVTVAGTLDGVQFADQQPGATVQNKLDNCLSSASMMCVASPGMGTGSPTSYPNGKILWDLRNGSANINGTSSSFMNSTSTGDFFIPFRFEMGLNPAANSTVNQFGNLTEAFSYIGNSHTFSGQQTAVYGSYSHFGSGNAASLTGGGFEAFNPGSATVTTVIGVTGNGWNGGVSGGVPFQSATNTGNATTVVGIKGFVGNVSTGTITSATSLFADSIINTGGGTITTATGLKVLDQTAGQSNFGITTGLGFNIFGDVVKINGSSNLPAATPAALFLASGSNPVAGRILFSDGTGWQMRFGKRSASTTTDLFTFLDTGELDLTTIKLNGGSSISLKQRIQNQSTGSIGATTRTEVLVSWPVTMGDTNYTATCAVQDSTTAAATQGLTLERLRTKSATQVGLVINNPTAGAITGSIDCIGEHQ